MALHVQEAMARSAQAKPAAPAPQLPAPRRPPPPAGSRPAAAGAPPLSAPLQPKAPENFRRPAPHVKAATAALQRKAAAALPPFYPAARPCPPPGAAPHVRAVTAMVQRKASPPAPSSPARPAARPAPSPRPAPHVRAATAALQRKASPAPAQRPAPLAAGRPAVTAKPAAPAMAGHLQAALRAVRAAGNLQRAVARPAIQRASLGAADAAARFRYLNTTEQGQFDKLAKDVKQELYKNSKLALSEQEPLSKETQELYRSLLESNRALHLGSNPALGDPWEEIRKAYGGGKTGAAFYSHIRSPGYSAALKLAGIDPAAALAAIGKSGKKPKAPEVHHLIYKAEEPGSAVLLWNLMLATRGSSDGTVGLHEMLHTASSPPGRPNISQSVYVNEVPAVKGLIRQWAQGPRPVLSVPNALFNPAHKVYEEWWDQLPPLGPEFLSYSEPFHFPDPPLHYLEKDNSYFARQHDLALLGSDDGEHEHWNLLDAELDLPLTASLASGWGSSSGFPSSSSSGFVGQGGWGGWPDSGFDQPVVVYPGPGFGGFGSSPLATASWDEGELPPLFLGNSNMELEDDRFS